MKQHGIHLSVPFLDGAALDLLVGELNTQFAAMEDEAQVMASGQSCKQGWGFIEVLWNGDEVDPEFLEEQIGSTFIATNQHGQIYVLEIPGGDDVASHLLVGPHLFGSRP